MKIAVMGAAGRMGRELIRAIAAEPGCSISGATETPGSPVLGKDIGTLAGLDPVGGMALAGGWPGELQSPGRGGQAHFSAKGPSEELRTACAEK